MLYFEDIRSRGWLTGSKSTFFFALFVFVCVVFSLFVDDSQRILVWLDQISRINERIYKNLDSTTSDQIMRCLDLHHREKARNPNFFKVNIDSVARWHTEKLKVGSMGDRLFSFNLNMLADAKCRRGDTCYDPTCIFLHRTDVVEDDKAVEGAVYVLLSEALEMGIVTRGSLLFPFFFFDLSSSMIGSFNFFII